MSDDLKQKLIISGLIIFIVISLIVGIGIGRYYPNKNSEYVKQLINEQVKIEKEKYNLIIEDKDKNINEIKSKLSESKKLNLNYEKEINKLKVQIVNIKTPTNEKEIRERFKRLGYETY